MFSISARNQDTFISFLKAATWKKYFGVNIENLPDGCLKKTNDGTDQKSASALKVNAW